MNFVRNTWYPAAFSSDIADAPVRRTIIGENVVLYRRTDKSIAALDDLCPHRMLPLSQGRIKGDSIECGYHGMVFDGTGKCIHIPGQDTIPAKARVTAYAIAERFGIAWIWMGTPESADLGLLLELPAYDDPHNAVVQGDALRIEANYLNLADNLCDPSHVGFVHASTLGNAASVGVPVQSTSSGRLTTVWRWVLDSPPIPLFAKTGLVEGNVDRWHYYFYHAPNIAVIDFGTAPAGQIGPNGDRGEGLQIHAVHCITPVDEAACIDHWFLVRNFGQNDPGMGDQLKAGHRTAFEEDKAILEAIHQEETRRPDFETVSLALDAAPTRMRRIVKQLIDAEA
jgi:vanillate O-demethylase monooxygenase subunit